MIKTQGYSLDNIESAILDNSSLDKSKIKDTFNLPDYPN